MDNNINKTLLDPYTVWDERGIIHRDYMAHLFRWSFVGRLIQHGESILDVGAGIGNLAETIYRNRFKPSKLVALEIHQPFIVKLMQLANKVNFPMQVVQHDIRREPWPVKPHEFSVVTCFEVLEHFEKVHLDLVLRNMALAVETDGTVLISTPNYDGIHMADNHIHEYTEQELQAELVKHFDIANKYGTFMSLGTPANAAQILSPMEFDIYNRLHEYYNSSVLSVLFAPLHPSESRNILWVLKPKESAEF